MSCWVELELVWHDASIPTKLHILHYSRWCLDQGGDVLKAVSCAFIEHVVEHSEDLPLFRAWYDDETIKNLMPLWIYNYREKANRFVSRLLAITAAEKSQPEILKKRSRKKR